MKNTFLLIAMALTLPLHSYSAPRLLSEADLMGLSQGYAPQLDEIEASLLAAQNAKNLVNEKYAAEAFGKASYAETQERPIIEFIPIFSPVKQAQLGVRKNFEKGFRTQLLATADQRSASSAIAGSYDNVTTTSLAFTIEMDLWKNLLGRMSETERLNADLSDQRARLDKEIRSRAFQISLRKIYWSLVATEEQLKISERLKSTATRQLQDARRRVANSIGDRGDVARYEAQLASRGAQNIYYNFQKENLIKQLRTMLPSLGQEELGLQPYDIDKTIALVLECSQVITQESSIPFHHTKYDEIVKILREEKSNQKVLNDRYSDVDVNLFGTVKSTGVGSDKLSASEYRGSYGDAVRDMKNNNRAGYEAGINFSVPIGDAKETTQKTKTLYDEKRLLASINNTEAQLSSTHSQLKKTLLLLQEMIISQKVGTAALERRMKVVQQKYDQARISVNDVILDQDALLNSELTTLDAQLQAVNVLLDYLMVFTDTPCTFNRI